MDASSVRKPAVRVPEAQVQAPTLRLLAGVRVGAGHSAAVPAAPDRVPYESRHHVQAVLALCGASRRGMARDELVDVLWPKAGPTAGRNRLYHTVHLARQALSAVSWDDEWVVVRDARVMLDERVWCDMHRLERAGARDAAELGDAELHDLVPLCDGDWAPGLDVGAVGETVRSRVRGTQGALLREAVVRSQRQGDTPALRALLHSLLRIQSTDEWVHRELMRLDLAAGRRHAVLRTFDKLSRELSVQLGLRPSGQTIAVAAAAAAELQSHPVGGALEPFARATSLVGREGLVQSLVVQMTERAGLWNFTGLSGIGKTTLARAVAHRLAPAMADGVCMVHLGDLGPYESAASACARTLGLTSSEQGDEAELLVRTVQTRQMLLILDDIDAASDAASLLARLPIESMRARVIVTTRARVDVVQAQVVPVALLPTPAPDATAAQAQQSAGFALFQMRCPLAGHGSDSAAWQREAVQLVRRLDGLPLAIELAAARTASMTPGEILRQIDRTLRPLGDGPVDMQGRHRSLQASLDWSVKLLGEAARSGYGALAVFPGSFDPDDVSKLMPAVGLTRKAAGAVLDELIAAGLLTRAQDGPRLRMLHLPRAHARAQAEARGHWNAVLAARLADVCRCLDESPLAYESPQYAANLRRVMELEDDAVSLLKHAQALDPHRFVRMLSALSECWSVRGSVPIMMRWIEAGAASAHALGLPDQELAFRVIWTQALRVRESAASAEQCSRNMTPSTSRATDPVTLARAAAVRYSALRSIGQAEEGAELLGRWFDKLALDRGSPGFWTLCVALNECDRLPAGVDIDLDALRERFAGSRLWLEMLRVTYSKLPDVGDWHRLLRIAEELIARATAMHAHAACVSGLSARAQCQFGLDDAAAALQSFEACFRLAAETGWKKAMAGARLDAAWVHVHLSDAGSAGSCVEEASALLNDSDRASHFSRIPLLRSIVFTLRGELPDAVRELLSMPARRIDELDADELSDWAEAGSLLGMRLGHAALAGRIATAMRQLDLDHDHVPAVRRFRDRMFGPTEPRGPDSTEQVDDLRQNLCTWLKELHRVLA